MDEKYKRKKGINFAACKVKRINFEYGNLYSYDSGQRAKKGKMKKPNWKLARPNK